MKKLLLILLSILIITSFIFSAQNVEDDDNESEVTTSRPRNDSPPDESFINLNQNNGNEEEERTGYTLPLIIKKILRNSSIINSARSMEDYYLAKIKEIKAEREPSISFETIFSPPIPSFPTPAPGSSWYNTINWNRWGMANRTSLTISLPLYTFGRTDRGIDAARQALAIERINTVSAKFNLVAEIKKYYYGYLFAVSIRDYLLKTVMSRLNSAIEKAEKNLKLGKAKKTEVYNLNNLKLTLQTQQIDLLKNIDIAHTAFKSFLEIPQDKDFKLKEELISAKDFTLQPLDFYIKTALKNNEQYQRAKHGLNARKALVEYQKVQNNPILFIGLNAYYQGKIPFKHYDISGIMDDSFSILLGFGLRWSLNPNKQNAIINQAQAEYLKLEFELKTLEKKLPIDVKSAFLEVKSAKEKLKIAEEAYINGRRWMMHNYKMYMIDSATTDELATGFSQYAYTRNAYFQAIYNYNLSIANLSKLIGVELTDLRY